MCGIFGVYSSIESDKIGALCLTGMHALQHRGQEGAGIALFNAEKSLVIRRSHSYVVDIISNQEFNLPPSQLAVGHLRYATSGGKSYTQPMSGELIGIKFALAHNGNLVNIDGVRDRLTAAGVNFKTDVDTEVIANLISSANTKDFIEGVKQSLSHIEGAYSLIIGTSDNRLIGIRDPNGIRPLVLGKLENNYILSSETCALNMIGAQLIREVEPGEIIVIDDAGVTSIPYKKNEPHKFCIFEYVYFARPDSEFACNSVYQIRKEIGKLLAVEYPAKDADLVVPVLDSGLPAAMGYAESSKLPLEIGLTRSHYVARTFIQPTPNMRSLGVKFKHLANSAVVKGKNIVLVDDSIVRGHTAKSIVNLLREAGAQKIYMLISSPPIVNPCYYGIDTPSHDSLISYNYSTDEIAKMIGVDFLGFISIEGLYRATGNKQLGYYCDACMTGDYVTGI